MSQDNQEFNIKLGRIGSNRNPRQKKFLHRVLKAAQTSGHIRTKPKLENSNKPGRKSAGRARINYSKSRLFNAQRRVIIKARIVRHSGLKYGAASLKRYMHYLQRDSVTKDGEKAHVFDAQNDIADDLDFTKSCEDDRHHFRFIISPEDMPELADAKAFTRDLMKQMEADCGTQLEWVSVAHWNTDNPHIHLAVRGVAQDSSDLVISRDYMSYGFRSRAEDLVSLELGPKPAHEIQKALEREVTAERWTKLDREIMQVADDMNFVDLRAAEPEDTKLRTRRLMIGRLQHLEKMSLATNAGPSQWVVGLEAESTLRNLGTRGDIIKTMHMAFRGEYLDRDPHDFVIENQPQKPVIGRLIDKGLHDELTGEAYAIIDGVDGKVHYVRLKGIEAFNHAPEKGGIVELRSFGNEQSKKPGYVLSVRSDLDLNQQITAKGATWLDHRLVEKNPMEIAHTGFGKDVQRALIKRIKFLESQGLTRIQGLQILPASNLLKTLREKEIGELIQNITNKTRLHHQPHKTGETVQGIYRQRFTLASGRFALLDNGLNFQIVPWASSMEKKLGQYITGVVRSSGGIQWNLDKNRNLLM